MQAERLTLRETHTGYWTVVRGSVQVASAMTRAAAEREREMLARLNARAPKRTGKPPMTMLRGPRAYR
ncbi:MAG TPA: hypothetical protein VGG08_08925 [Solirubrobacteraceae bacterium]|jgi:GH24 family phage-related lysozyme (muramidase)